MKRLVFIVFLLCSFFFVTKVSAQPTSGMEHIESFKSTINIRQDAIVEVSENIVYDFGNESRHGIYRNIPFIKKNTEGKKYKMDITINSVVDDVLQPYTYSSSKEGDYIKVKIGDADTTITGVHTYVINYNVRGALTYFSDHDELYWNSTGNEWEVPISSAQAIITLPQEIPTENIDAICYTGSTGSTESNCSIALVDRTFTIDMTSGLNPQEGLSFAVRFPPALVAVQEATEVVAFFDTLVGKMVGIGIILFALWWYVALPLWLPIRWWIAGRDPKTTGGPVSAWFDPPQTKKKRPLTPAETGTLIDEHAGPRELSSLLINLAQRGYLKIVEKKKGEFELHKGKEFVENTELLSFEKTFLEELFVKGHIVNLKSRNLADEVEKVLQSLYESLVTEGFFPENPDKVRKKYSILVGFAAFTFNFPLLLSAGIFGRLMPHKTIEGVQAAHVTRSLKNFLTSQERQLEFQAKNQIMFEKLLPFAIAFGVEKVWAERFKDIQLTQPDWYQGAYVGAFNSQTFTRSLGSSLSSFRSAATPVSSSSGHSSGFSGGSSGGGGGGGGGGSW